MIRATRLPPMPKVRKQMARGDLTIKFETRPCIVRGKRGTFHQWCQRGGKTYALVEWENGHVDIVTPTKIQFTDVIGY